MGTRKYVITVDVNEVWVEDNDEYVDIVDVDNITSKWWRGMAGTPIAFFDSEDEAIEVAEGLTFALPVDG